MGPSGFVTCMRGTGYIGLFTAMLLANLGIPAVGSAALVLMLPFLISPEWCIAAAVSAAGESAGQFIQYCAARFGIRTLLDPFRRRAEAMQSHQSRFEMFYQRYGSAAVFVCRFIPGLKSFSSFPAGLARMPIAPFLTYTVLGASISLFALSWIVHAAGKRSPVVTGYAREHAALLFVVVIAGGMLVAWLKRWSGRR
jgi:membrane protein DedA with SNARE-associated domain